MTPSTAAFSFGQLSNPYERATELRVVQRKGLRRGGAVGDDLDDSLGAGRGSLQQLLCLSLQLIDVWVLAHRASGRVGPVNHHDEMLGWTQSFPRTWVTPVRRRQYSARGGRPQ